MASDLGWDFAEALAHKDAARLKVLLRPDVQPSDEITQVIGVETATIGSRRRVGYRFGVTNGEDDFVVEQQAYFEQDGDQIGWLRVMCAGFQSEA